VYKQEEHLCALDVRRDGVPDPERRGRGSRLQDALRERAGRQQVRLQTAAKLGNARAALGLVLLRQLRELIGRRRAPARK
jgi:hypothetical protein